jgi:hypothetical protein
MFGNARSLTEFTAELSVGRTLAASSLSEPSEVNVIFLDAERLED